ncbi:sugar transferase [Hungatella sp.]|uniref:sugar transferase n=1 Tax=Hungatella sp. TaxID=2613924 RepID=UPI002A801D47|nr:sugar transferase [Hungatella sp.]
MLKEWEQLPAYMKTEAVRPYYNILKKKKYSLFLKRTFDIVVSSVMMVLLSPVMLFLAIVIAVDSKGGVFFRQVRVTQYGRKFRIHKFRTMIVNAEKLGNQVTMKNDSRVTKIGAKMRKYRLDELPQLIDVFLGDMSFVGTRPETTKFVNFYSKEMYATLLLPAGITSEASIRYKDEAELLDAADDIDQIYIEYILPRKMKYNLESIREFSFMREIATMFRTVFVVLGKEYK